MITYLCGGINGLSDAACVDWRAEATQLLNTAVLDPMRRDYRRREAENVDDIVNGDLFDIRQADIILVNASRPSWGTAMEMVYARQAAKAIVVFTLGGRISPWLQYHASQVFEQLADAVGYINAMNPERRG